MRTLIIGASGFVGTALRTALEGDVHGTYHSHSGEGLRPLDMRDPAAVRSLFAEIRPQLVLHPAAQPHVDWCEDHVEESAAVNVAGTRNVVEACRASGARYVFFSTDYLFDGDAGPYREDAQPRPLNVYGRHKLEAEHIIQAELHDYLIVRVCNVFGFEPAGKNFVMALLARSRSGEAMNVPADQWGNPTYADNLAAAVKELCATTQRGVLHVVGPESMDRVAFARLACSVFGIDSGFLRPRTTVELAQRARRPLRGGLDSTRARAILKTPLLTPRQGLEHMKRRLQETGHLP
jgi:dTDP-4-dehydrorhamnose reductase